MVIAGLALAFLALGVGLFVWIGQPESLGYPVRFYIVLLSLVLILVGFVIAACPLFLRSNKRTRRKDNLYFVIDEHEDPWVQSNMNIQDYHTTIRTPGILYTYRIAIANRGADVIRDVEVKLTSIRPKPHDFNSIGGHLQFRHEPSDVKTMHVPPTKQLDFLDAIFVDVFIYFINDTGSGSWLEACTIVPGQRGSRGLRPPQNYAATVTATSRTGEQACGELQWIMREDGSPVLQLMSNSASDQASL